MNEKDITKSILQALAAIENDIANPSIGTASPDQLIQKTYLAKPILINKLRELSNEGHILFDEDHDIIALDKSGRQLLKELKYNSTKNIGTQNIIFNAPVSNSNIIQGDNATASLTNNFFQALEREIENSALSPEERKTWLTRVKDFSSHPLVVELLSKVLGGLCTS